MLLGSERKGLMEQEKVQKKKDKRLVVIIMSTEHEAKHQEKSA